MGDGIGVTYERWASDSVGMDVSELKNRIDAMSLMKGSTLTRAIIRINSIMPVRGIVTLS